MAKSSKGSAFEREICKALSRWWSGGNRDDIFWRTAGSGALATTRRKQGKMTHGQDGDVAAIDPLGEPLVQFVSIEMKRGYNKTSLHDILDAAKPQPLDFIEQASFAQKPVWLIWRRDRRKTVIAVEVPRPVAGLFSTPLSLVSPRIELTLADGREFICVDFDFFQTHVSPKVVRKAAQVHKQLKNETGGDDDGQIKK